jgi:hypothetical protein
MLQPNKTGLVKFTVPTFARVNLDKINKRNKPFNSIQADKRSSSSATKQNVVAKQSAEKKENSKMSSSGLLNPLIEQILRELPTAHPS